MRLLRTVPTSVLPATIVGLAALLAACGAPTNDDESVNVIASMYPAAFLAERIGGDLVAVRTLTEPGTDPHDVELSPRRTIELLESDVVVWFGGIQPAIDAAIAESERDSEVTVDLGAGLGIDVDHHDHDHKNEHDHGDLDPHVWLDPTAMNIAAERTAQALIAASPEHAEEFSDRLNTLRLELDDLDERFNATLADCEHRVFVTSHTAFGHLAATYELEQVAIAGIDPHSEPSTATLAAIADLVESEGITTVFTERLASDAMAQVISRETGATTAILDPIEGLTTETENEDYLSLMDANLDALALALECR